jgi:hypothetical protein
MRVAIGLKDQFYLGAVLTTSETVGHHLDGRFIPVKESKLAVRGCKSACVRLFRVVSLRRGLNGVRKGGRTDF